jgi:transposase
MAPNIPANIVVHRGFPNAMRFSSSRFVKRGIELQEISSQVSQNAFAVLTLDGAGWHQRGDRLVLPDNIGLLHLPSYSPELNPVETLWEFL